MKKNEISSTRTRNTKGENYNNEKKNNKNDIVGVIRPDGRR